MNFDTKYLIRWGIPGWLMVMVLFPFFIIIHFSSLSNHVSNASDLLAIGAVLTVLGVPLGYLLNQLHHSLFWVLPRLKNDGWDKYFKEEISIDEYLETEPNNNKKERYRYLLSRKHELGGIVISLGISVIIISIHCIYIVFFTLEKIRLWESIYWITVILLFLIMWLSRNYSSANILKYHDEYLNKINSNGSP